MCGADVPASVIEILSSQLQHNVSRSIGSGCPATRCNGKLITAAASFAVARAESLAQAATAPAPERSCSLARCVRAQSSAAAKRADPWRVPQTVARPPSNLKSPSPAPDVPPVNQADLEMVVDFLRAHPKLLVVTGAGCSTESNIPDYRGPNGAYTSGFKPMYHQQVRMLPKVAQGCLQTCCTTLVITD
jgi:hypothetical protein